MCVSVSGTASALYSIERTRCFIEYSGHIVMQSSQDSHFRALVLYLPLDMPLSQLYTVKYSVL